MVATGAVIRPAIPATEMREEREEAAAAAAEVPASVKVCP